MLKEPGENTVALIDALKYVTIATRHTLYRHEQTIHLISDSQATDHTITVDEDHK